MASRQSGAAAKRELASFARRTRSLPRREHRGEAFEQWAHDNPAEVERIQWEASEREAERLIAEYVAAGYEVEEVA